MYTSNTHGDKEVRQPRLITAEKSMIYTGLLGFLLAAVCGVWVLINGGQVLPDGDVSKAISFNAAIGIFLISTALVSPFARMGNKVRKTFSWSYIVLSLYAYFAETVQNFRGVNPRFVVDGSAFDTLVGNLFGAVAMLLIVFYLLFAVYFFRRNAYRANPEMVLSVRYSVFAILLSFAAGIWISVNMGRFTGAEGNIIWLHGLGFHALQAIPIVAWLIQSASLPAQIRHRYIHYSGGLYLAGLLAVGWQTVLGQPVLEWSVLPIAAGLSFLLALGVGAMALLQALSGQRPEQVKRM